MKQTKNVLKNPSLRAVDVGPAGLLARQTLADLVAVAVVVVAADGAARRPLAQLVGPAVAILGAHGHAELAAVALHVVDKISSFTH